MKILALNPFHGGSHRAFLNGWRQRSQHDFTLKTLSAHHWKWRMRNAAFHFANELTRSDVDSEDDFDVIFCTDMLNLAEFRGLAPVEIARRPAVLYFHENQLTYPVQEEQERDLHFAYTNFISACSAEYIWFNSEYHRCDFLEALERWLPTLPEGKRLSSQVGLLVDKSAVHPPGLSVPEDPPVPRSSRSRGSDSKPLHLLWVSRWEHDKGPEIFFDALRELKRAEVPFRLSVLGEAFSQSPEVFAEAEQTFREEIIHWGYLPDYAEYQQVLREADIVISTARHEFFGIAILEAIASGCRPFVPNALAYPCVLPPEEDFFHSNMASEISTRLQRYASELAENRTVDDVWRVSWHQFVTRYAWENLAPQMDSALEGIEQR